MAGVTVKSLFVTNVILKTPTLEAKCGHTRTSCTLAWQLRQLRHLANRTLARRGPAQMGGRTDSSIQVMNKGMIMGMVQTRMDPVQSSPDGQTDGHDTQTGRLHKPVRSGPDGQTDRHKFWIKKITRHELFVYNHTDSNRSFQPGPAPGRVDRSDCDCKLASMCPHMLPGGECQASGGECNARAAIWRF